MCVEWVEDDARKEEGDGGRWREKRLRASGCVWRLSHSRHTFRSPAYPDWAQRRSALSASLSECLISHSVHDHRWSHPLSPTGSPTRRARSPAPSAAHFQYDSTLKHNNGHHRTPSSALLSLSLTYFPLSPSVSIHTTSHLSLQVPAYHIRLLAPDQTRDRIPFQQTQPSPSPERKQIRFTSSISKNPTRCPLLYTSRLMIQYSIFTCLASRCLPPTSRSTSMSLLITFETQIKHYATEIDLSPRLRIQM